MKQETGDTVKDAIAAALIRLMKDKRLEQITIQEISKQAWVGRSTFYRNFESKEDVLHYHIRVLLDASQRELNPYSDDRLRDFVISQFRLCRKHKDFFIALQKNDLLHLLYKQGAVITRDNIAEFDLYRNPYQAVFFSSAAIGVIVQWIEGGFRESEETMADIFIYLMDGHHRLRRTQLDNHSGAAEGGSF